MQLETISPCILTKRLVNFTADSLWILVFEIYSKKTRKIKVNENIFVAAGMLKIVACPKKESKGKIRCLIFQEIGHVQPPTPVHCDTSTAAEMLMTDQNSNVHA